jgi:hypothetical protein
MEQVTRHARSAAVELEPDQVGGGGGRGRGALTRATAHPELLQLLRDVQHEPRG